jgi:uncharacterized protein YecE (DUF72 family)
VGTVHVGTCAWTEKTMVDLWYPKGVTSPEQRLRYYASKFDTVEVDSPFYALPVRSYAEKWVERTPADFIFNVKAYGMMTGHEVEERSLAPELREYEFEVTDRGRVRHPHRDMVAASFDLFVHAIEPLKDAGKMGGVLMQFPPYFTATTREHERRNLDYIEYAKDKLAGYRMLVEFRHPSWMADGRAHETLRWLAERDLTYVCVDSPQFPDRSTMPAIAAVTSAWAYLGGSLRLPLFDRGAARVGAEGPRTRPRRRDDLRDVQQQQVRLRSEERGGDRHDPRGHGASAGAGRGRRGTDVVLGSGHGPAKDTDDRVGDGARRRLDAVSRTCSDIGVR